MRLSPLAFACVVLTVPVPAQLRNQIVSVSSSRSTDVA